MLDCWNCGQRGIPWPLGTVSAIRRICETCDVLWSALPMAPGQVVTEVAHYGQAIPAVDFTRPGALSCPA